jgi:hypothetical protein
MPPSIWHFSIGFPYGWHKRSAHEALPVSLQLAKEIPPMSIILSPGSKKRSTSYSDYGVSLIALRLTGCLTLGLLLLGRLEMRLLIAMAALLAPSTTFAEWR